MSITELYVSLNKDEEKQLQVQGFIKLPVNLNEGTEGDCLYLWYKKGTMEPITKIQFSFTDKMNQGLSNAGFKKIDRDLNTGTNGDPIYLWYFRGSSEYNIPIVDLQVSTEPSGEAQNFKDGYERSACDLNRNAGGKRPYLWVKREKKTYICDVAATDGFEKDLDYFQKGYIRVDENTNRGAGGDSVFIWYRQTTDAKKGLTDLQISTSAEEAEQFKKQGFSQVPVNLNEMTGGDTIYLWRKKDDSKEPIRDVTVITNVAAVGPYTEAGVHVIQKSLNKGNKGVTEYLCYYPESHGNRPEHAQGGGENKSK